MIRYIRSLGASAREEAEHHNRTQPNVFDLQVSLSIFYGFVSGQILFHVFFFCKFQRVFDDIGVSVEDLEDYMDKMDDMDYEL